MLAGCGDMGFNNWGWRRRLLSRSSSERRTISESSVVSVLWWANFFDGPWGGAPWHSRVNGEAVTVDLGARGKLFAALSSANNPEYTANLATRTLSDTIDRAWGKEQFSRVMKAEGVIVISRKLYPLFVTFTDINDPKTVKLVDPGDLAALSAPVYR